MNIYHLCFPLLSMYCSFPQHVNTIVVDRHNALSFPSSFSFFPFSFPFTLFFLFLFLYFFFMSIFTLFILRKLVGPNSLKHLSLLLGFCCSGSCSLLYPPLDGHNFSFCSTFVNICTEAGYSGTYEQQCRCWQRSQFRWKNEGTLKDDDDKLRLQ